MFINSVLSPISPVSVKDVCITEQMSKRPRRAIDLTIENRILHSLAGALTLSPGKLLEQLVDLACEICNAESAGVSLLEVKPDGMTMFRWVAMGGSYKKYLGDSASRAGSSCEDCMRLDAPQLYSLPGRFSEYQSATDPTLIEELIVPIPGEEGKSSIGTIWIASHSIDREFDLEDARLMTSLASFTAAALRMQDLLMKEQAARKIADEARQIADGARKIADSANEAKTSFLTNMSHEIRTPMNAVIGLSDILSMSSPLTGRQREFVRTLQSSARSLMDLINDILDIAKIEADRFDVENLPFSLSQVIEEVVSMISVRANQKKIDFYVSNDAVKGLTFIGDGLRVRQIITNLCSNAVKFTSHGSVQVKITSAPSPEKGVKIIEISVMDSGIGIETSKIEGIFEKFNQGDTSISRRYGGTGLGLAITKGLVECMGGNISVSSTLGKGSTFTVTLPLRIEINNNALLEIDDVLKLADYSEVDRSCWPHILLVEDYKPNAIVAEVYLEEFGYECDSVTNGREAIQKAKDKRYTAIIMDVQMPEIDGLEATRTIRANEKSSGQKPSYIIGMTAHAMAGDREKCLQAGMNDYLPKPFDPKLLKSKLADLGNSQ